MSTVVSAPASVRTAPRSATLGHIDKCFYAFMSLLITAIVTFGFSRTVDHNLVHASVRRLRSRAACVLLWISTAPSKLVLCREL